MSGPFSDEMIKVVAEKRAKSAAERNAEMASTEIDLDIEQARADAATPGPWYPRYLDDDCCMNLVAVSTEPDTGQHEKHYDVNEGSFIGVLLAQQGFNANISHDSELWDENATFIARSRTLVPLLIERVRELEREDADRYIDSLPNFEEETVRPKIGHLPNELQAAAREVLDLHDAWGTDFYAQVLAGRLVIDWDTAGRDRWQARAEQVSGGWILWFGRLPTKQHGRTQFKYLMPVLERSEDFARHLQRYLRGEEGDL